MYFFLILIFGPERALIRHGLEFPFSKKMMDPDPHLVKIIDLDPLSQK
jgi:hypothetical protein